MCHRAWPTYRLAAIFNDGSVAHINTGSSQEHGENVVRAMVEAGDCSSIMLFRRENDENALLLAWDPDHPLPEPDPVEEPAVDA